MTEVVEMASNNAKIPTDDAAQNTWLTWKSGQYDICSVAYLSRGSQDK